MQQVLLQGDWRGRHGGLRHGLRGEERVEGGELVVTRPGSGGGQGGVGRCDGNEGGLRAAHQGGRGVTLEVAGGRHVVPWAGPGQVEAGRRLQLMMTEIHVDVSPRHSGLEDPAVAPGRSLRRHGADHVKAPAREGREGGGTRLRAQQLRQHKGRWAGGRHRAAAATATGGARGLAHRHHLPTQGEVSGDVPVLEQPHLIPLPFTDRVSFMALSSSLTDSKPRGSSGSSRPNFASY